MALPLRLESLHLDFWQYPRVAEEEATQAKWSTLRDNLLQRHSALRHVYVGIGGSGYAWQLK